MLQKERKIKRAFQRVVKKMSEALGSSGAYRGCEKMAAGLWSAVNLFTALNLTKDTPAL